MPKKSFFLGRKAWGAPYEKTRLPTASGACRHYSPVDDRNHAVFFMLCQKTKCGKVDKGKREGKLMCAIQRSILYLPLMMGSKFLLQTFMEDRRF